MNNFTYNISTKVFFGEGTVNKIGTEIGKFSSRILIAYGSERIKSSGLFEIITNDLKEHGVFYKEINGIKPNPSIKSVNEGIKLIKEHKLNFILAIGGGSVIDASKAMAAGASMDVDPWLFCTHKAKIKSALPLATVLTLSATGSEMNGNAVISNEETGEKLAFGTDLTRPVFSILDPSLTYSVPTDQTAYGVIDIFTHVCELYFDPTDSALLIDRISEAILNTCIHYGHTAIDEPKNYEARANLMWAGSLALNGLIGYGKSGGDWSTHGIEHELSAVYDIAHGLGLAIVLPNWMKYVLNDETVDRFAMFADKVWNIKETDKYEQALQGINATSEFFKSLGVPSTLTEIGIDSTKIEHMAAQATQFGELGAVKKLDKKDVQAILENSL